MLRSGRLPQECRPERCEVVRLRGRGPLPSAPGPPARRGRTRRCFARRSSSGTSSPRSRASAPRATLSPAFQEAARLPPPAARAARARQRRRPAHAARRRSRDIYRSYSWVVPLRSGSVHAWDVATSAPPWRAPRSSLCRPASAGFALDAPVEELRDGRARRARSPAAGSCSSAGEAPRSCSPSPCWPPSACAGTRTRRERGLTWYGARRLAADGSHGRRDGAHRSSPAPLPVGRSAPSPAGSSPIAPVSPPGDVLRHSTLSTEGLARRGRDRRGPRARALRSAAHAPDRARRGARISPLDAAAVGAPRSSRSRSCAATSTRRRSREEQRLGGRARAAPRPHHVRRGGPLRPPLPPRPARSRARSRGAARSPLRLAAVSLARHPGHAAVAIAFLVVSVGLAVFAESYRTTLARGQSEQAAYAVPLDFTVREDLSRLVPVVDAAPSERFRALGRGVRVEPVLRRGREREPGRRRDRDHRARGRRRGAAGARRLAGGLRDAPFARGARTTNRGARRAARAADPRRRLRAARRGRGAGPITLTASVETRRGNFVTVILGRDRAARGRRSVRPSPRLRGRSHRRPHAQPAQDRRAGRRRRPAVPRNAGRSAACRQRRRPGQRRSRPLRRSGWA